MKEILFVGRRQAAVDAAEALGFRASIQEVAPRDEQATGAYGGSVEDSLAAARTRFHNKVPAAVVAVAEGAVPAAASIREHFGLPGLDGEAARCCHDKLAMKHAIVAAGIPCAPWLETTHGTTPEEIADRLGLPAVVKLPISSGGRGVAICATLDEIAAVLHPGLLVEGFTAGVEMSVETFRQDGVTLFRNHTRYLVPHWASIAPADLPAVEARAVNALAERVHEALGIDEGMTHMELFLGPDGPVFGEIAARPPGGRLMELIARAWGFDPWQALLRIALGQTPKFPQKPQQFAGAWLLYPDAGRVTRIHGLSEARKMPDVARLSCRAKPGREYGEREGTGQMVGELIVVADAMERCERSLREAREVIRFDVESIGG